MLTLKPCVERETPGRSIPVIYSKIPGHQGDAEECFHVLLGLFQLAFFPVKSKYRERLGNQPPLEDLIRSLPGVLSCFSWQARTILDADRSQSRRITGVKVHSRDRFYSWYFFILSICLSIWLFARSLFFPMAGFVGRERNCDHMAAEM